MKNSSFPYVRFLDAVSDCTGGNSKVQRKDYAIYGELPVIDQGQDFISGYTDKSNQYKGLLPIVLFGDHTRIFKYVDFPFALGADGVKALQPLKGFNAKFLFYYFRSIKLHNAGYSRHFKFLKEISVPQPSLIEQRRIVDILSRAEGIVRLQREAQKKAAEIIPALFLDMFGDPATNPKGWAMTTIADVATVQGGLQVSTARNALPLERPYLRVANVYRTHLNLSEIKFIRLTEAEFKRVRLEGGDLLVVEGHGNPAEIGRVGIWDGSVENCVHQNHLIRVRCHPEKALSVFVWALLNSQSGRHELLRKGKTTSGLNTISTSNVKESRLTLPPIRLQQEFADRVHQTQSIKSQQNAALQDTEAVFATLLAQAFASDTQTQ